MPARQLYYTKNGTDVLGPVSSDWLWRSVHAAQLPPETMVCEEGSQDWLLFSSLPDSVFSVHVLAEAAKSTNQLLEAEQLHAKAMENLFHCQAQVQVYFHHTAECQERARNGLEFIEAALRLAPNNPIYLNTKALLYTDGLGDKQRGMALLQQAAQKAPNNIQIQQNIRNAQKQGCLIVFGVGISAAVSLGYALSRLWS